MLGFSLHSLQTQMRSLCSECFVNVKLSQSSQDARCLPQEVLQHQCAAAADVAPDTTLSATLNQTMGLFMDILSAHLCGTSW